MSLLLRLVAAFLLAASCRGSVNYRFEDCPDELLLPSKERPSDVDHVRPADISLIAGLGDSITTGFMSFDQGEIFRGDFNYVGNSFCMGGDGNLSDHVTLPNILQSLNPALKGQSYGIGLSGSSSGLNVAYPGRWSVDMLRQALELVKRIKKLPEDARKNDWKLVNMFIGTNDILGYVWKGSASSKEEYARNIRDAIMIIQAEVPRTIISLVGMWNLDFSIRAIELILSIPRSVDPNFPKNAQRRIEEYREVLNQIAADPKVQSDQQAVVVQTLFDDIYKPLRKANGVYMKEFYAVDCFHLSKYGNSLAGKQLWSQLLQRVMFKYTSPKDMGDETQPLACPDPICPYIRTPGNSGDKC